MKLNAVIIATSILARAIGEHSKCDDLIWKQETCSASIGVQRYHAHLSSGNSCTRTVNNICGDSTISSSTHASLGSTSIHVNHVCIAAGAIQFNLLAGDATFSTLCTMLLLKGATDVTSIWSRGIVTLYLGRFMTSVIAVVRVNRLFSWQTSTTKDRTVHDFGVFMANIHNEGLDGS
jgi:hypothetical protein